MEKEVAEIIKAIHREVYGDTRRLGEAFSGGNVGLICLGKSIEKAADRIARAIEAREAIDMTTKDPGA